MFIEWQKKTAANSKLKTSTLLKQKLKRNMQNVLKGFKSTKQTQNNKNKWRKTYGPFLENVAVTKDVKCS